MSAFEQVTTIAPSGRSALEGNEWLLGSLFDDLGYSVSEICEMMAWSETDVTTAIEHVGMQQATGRYRSLSDQRCRSLATQFGLGPLRSEDLPAGDMRALLREKLSDRIQLKGIDQVFFRVVVDDWRETIEKRERIHA